MSTKAPMAAGSAAPRPLVGVGVIVVRDERVLLGRRLGSHGAGTWALPGGHLEFGEEVEACARREVSEETGLALGRLSRGPYTSDVFHAEGRHYVTLFVVADAPAGDPQVCEPDKCAEWSWFRWPALPEPLFLPLRSLVATGYSPFVSLPIAHPSALPSALSVSLSIALLAVPLAALGAGPAPTLEPEFGKCRQVAEARARLACYDAIPYDAPHAARPASAPAAAAARTADAPDAQPAAKDRFGLAGRDPKDELQSIVSSVPADFFGWGPNERIRLANGQVWEVVDGSSGSVGPANRQVTVRRGALGSYFLDFEGMNSSPRVRRLR